MEEIKEINKTNEQLHEEFEQALQTLQEKLYNLLHYGNYDIDDISRNLTTNRLQSMGMIVGKHRLVLRNKEMFGRGPGSTVEITFEENPVNQSLIDAWDRQIIDRDIAYHQRELEQLQRVKEELNK